MISRITKFKVQSFTSFFITLRYLSQSNLYFLFHFIKNNLLYFVSFLIIYLLIFSNFFIVKAMSYYQANGNSNDELVSQLKLYGIIRSSGVFEAMKKTDRGFYSKNMEEAYADRPHSIGHGVTISAPHMHATALELLEDHIKKPGARILDVGSGSGYLTACFARLADKDAKIIGIDIIEPLVEWSIKNLNKDDPNLIKSGRVTIKYGDGWKGDPENAPFDAIHVGASADKLPEHLVAQLKPEGRMIIPIGTWDQNLVQVDKDRHGKIILTDIMGVRYVPLVKSEYRERI